MMDNEQEIKISPTRTIAVITVTVVLVVVVGIVIGFLLREATEDGSIVPGTIPAPTVGTPTLRIISVTPDNDVTIRAYNFPTGIELDARIGQGGSDGSDGIQVGTTIADADGEVFAAFPIPVDFHGEEQLVIRLDGAGGYFAYHGFSNQ